MNTTIIFQSTITCPNCGYQKEETMPTDACEFFYECKNCKARLKPKQGDCCVYCSYGTVKCPPKQMGTCCCQLGRQPSNSSNRGRLRLWSKFA